MTFAEGDPEGQAFVAAFREELQKHGWTDGHNIRIDIRWSTPGGAESRQRFAKELVALQPKLILSQNTPSTAALLQQTRTIPIIFTAVSDPVGSGFVASLNGQAERTGFFNAEPTIVGKWVELLKEIAPRVTRVAFLFNPATATSRGLPKPFKAAAASAAIDAISHLFTPRLSSNPSLRRMHASRIADDRDANRFTTGHRNEIILLAARYRLPAVYPFRFFAELGGLLSYGNDRLDAFRHAASYADRILKGEKPSELPVQAPVKFELVINLKAPRPSASTCLCIFSSAPTR